MARVERGFFEIIFPYELQNLVVEIETVPGERRNMFGELRGVRVLDGTRRGLRLRRSVEGRKRRFDSETALAAAALGGGVFRGGEGERTHGEVSGRRVTVEEMVGFC